jgi:RNA polymerase sigma-70 factor (ECF subfamily)
MQQSSSDPVAGLKPAPGLMRLASRLAAGPDAEDLVQSTWLRALEHEGPVRARTSWLRRVLVNEQRMQIRAGRRRGDRERATGHAVETPVEVDHVVHWLEVARVVGELVEELDEPVRLVVRERYFHGDTAAEIARRHRIPAGTVRWRLKSGLDRLRAGLDARYGGRRALWAGGLAPTVVPHSASPPASAGMTPATKGVSAMSVKIVLAMSVLAVSSGAAAWVATQDDADEVNEVVGVAAHDDAPVASALASAPETVRDADATASPDRATWARRLAEIRAAHGSTAKPGASGPAAAAHAGADEPCDEPHVGMCTDEECMEQLADQVLGLVDGCKEFMGDVPRDLSLTANVVGAPDVGTIVEHVELSSEETTPADLQECLTESMYTLDLGPTESNVEQTITVMLGAHSVDDLAHVDLDDETRAELQQAIEQAGDDAKVHVVHLAEDE